MPFSTAQNLTSRRGKRLLDNFASNNLSLVPKPYSYIMKKLLLFTAAVFTAAGAFAQSCNPDGAFANAAPGLYPLGPLGPTCDLTAPKTIISLTDTLVDGPTGPITLYIDAMRVNAVEGLPAGLSLGTDVEASFDANGPWGYWYNTGSVPNQSSAVGCAFVYGSGGDWDAAIGGGPNNDGVYPLVFTIDARVAGTNPDVSFLIPNGTYVSNISPNFGGGPLYLYDTLVVANDYANISTIITGSENVDPASPYTYSVPNEPGVTYAWTATNGTITGGQGTNEVTVEWAGSGSIEVLLTDGGCQGVDQKSVTANPTGLDEIAGINASVYPNPSNGLFNLQLDNTDALSVRIIDVSGRVLRSNTLSGSTLYSLDMQSAPVGVYILELETTEGKTFKRLIKQ